MNKKFNNGAIFTIAKVAFGEDGHGGLNAKKNLKSRMAVRQALKFNYSIIANAYKNVTEMVDEIQKETFAEYFESGKAEENEQGILIKENYREEFEKTLAEKLNELTEQVVELSIHTIPEKEYLAWAELNDGQLTDMELDIIEVFVDFEEDKEAPEDTAEKVEGEVIGE